MPKKKKVEDILKKYQKKIAGEIEAAPEVKLEESFSREYEFFREEMIAREQTSYERWCNRAEKIFGITPSEKDLKKLNKSIEAASLQITPQGAMAFGVLCGLGIVLLAILYLLLRLVFGDFVFFFPLVLILFGIGSIVPIGRIPNMIASRWRLKASNQMVLCMLYVIMYMRHTSNLEHAIKFAAQHISDPLSGDLKKIFWDIETGKYSTIRESLDGYLSKWQDYSPEFVESFHLVESSLFEGSNDRRIQLLDKALDVMLEGTYEKMLHYAHDLKSPITVLHMLGVVLPILGLVIFPLISSFLGGLVKWYHLALVYNLLLPLVVYIIGVNILNKRPTGYGASEVSLDDPRFREYSYYKIGNKLVNPKYFFWFIGITIILIGLIPLILGFIDPIGADFQVTQNSKFLDYRCNNGDCKGPFSINAMLVSLLIPIGLALSIGGYYRARTKKLMVIRDKTKRLDKEFSGSLFQLGNRIEEGIPAELAFGNIAQNMRGTVSGDFFSMVNNNITRAGMSLNEALFNKERGAVNAFPSAIIESSMKVLMEGVKKGSKIAANSIISISQYIQRIHQINERLRDLLADIISNMKGQVSFLTPIIAGIVVGIGSMITNIIGLLSSELTGGAGGLDGGDFPGGISPEVLQIFSIQDVMPPYFFQLVVGIYVVEVIIILSVLASGIENGPDKLSEKNAIGRNLYIGVLFYSIVSLVITLLFNLLAVGIFVGIG